MQSNKPVAELVAGLFTIGASAQIAAMASRPAPASAVAGSAVAAALAAMDVPSAKADAKKARDEKRAAAKAKADKRVAAKWAKVIATHLCFTDRTTARHPAARFFAVRLSATAPVGDADRSGFRG